MAVMAKRKILVVEDNDLNRSLLCEILKPEYDVVEAENGREALERLRQYAGDFSLILLDIVMPVMDGYEFLAAIKEDPKFDSIPVIVTSLNVHNATEHSYVKE
ncbi:MAG: response regulator [Neglectibacter sp.]